MIVFYPKGQFKQYHDIIILASNTYFYDLDVFFSYGFLITINYCLNINRRSGSYSFARRVSSTFLFNDIFFVLIRTTIISSINVLFKLSLLML